MLGALIGDTVGSIYEFNNIHTTDFPLFSPSSTFTDDSIMTMAVAEWLLADPHHTHSSLIEIMERYYEEYPDPMGGYGNSFRVWLDTPTAQKKPYNSFGNGSAMRASACGWAANSRQEAMMLAKISAEITPKNKDAVPNRKETTHGLFSLANTALTKFGNCLQGASLVSWARQR